MDTIKVTDFAEFWKGTNNGETRYYATRDAGMGYDPEATKVKGYAVYDTTVAVSYAVELYPTKSQAENHKPAVAQKAPTSAIDDEWDGGSAYTTDHVNTADVVKDDEDGKKPSKTARRGATKKRGR